MAISGNLTINIGLPNESTGSDSLYTAFGKINTNFDTLFANASKVVAGNGITVTNNPSNTIISANLHDVIRVACANIEAAKFFPTHVVLNPLDVAKLQLTKTSTGEYTYPIFYLDNLSGQPKIANLTVVSTTWIAANTFLVADMSKDNLRMREAMNITFGYENDDFTRNMISIICETRAVNYIKANDLGAFQKGTISTSIAALDPAIAG